jgi:hypothetical protein
MTIVVIVTAPPPMAKCDIILTLTDSRPPPGGVGVTAFAEFLETSRRFWRTAFAGLRDGGHRADRGIARRRYLLHAS